MIIKNPHTGETKLTPKEQEKGQLIAQYKQLDRAKTVAALSVRLDAIEKILGLEAP
jgi:hypothetical protein